MALRISTSRSVRSPFIAALAVFVLFGGLYAADHSGYFARPAPADKLAASVLPGAVVALTNQERSSDSLGSLKASALLNQAAQLKADDMAAKSYYAHVSPDGTIPPAWLNKVGYRFQAMGENLVVDRESSEAVVSAWMGSEAHRENILNPTFTEIGIGVAYGNYKGRDTIYVVQMLARPQQAAAPPKVVVQPKPPPPPSTPKLPPITVPVPAPTRSAATTSVLVRPPPPKPVVRDTITPVLEVVASTTLAEVPSIIADVAINQPIVPPYVSAPIELSPPPQAAAPRTSVRTGFRSFVNGIGVQVRSFFRPIF